MSELSDGSYSTIKCSLQRITENKEIINAMNKTSIELTEFLYEAYRFISFSVIRLLESDEKFDFNQGFISTCLMKISLNIKNNQPPTVKTERIRNLLELCLTEYKTSGFTPTFNRDNMSKCFNQLSLEIFIVCKTHLNKMLYKHIFRYFKHYVGINPIALKQLKMLKLSEEELKKPEYTELKSDVFDIIYSFNVFGLGSPPSSEKEEKKQFKSTIEYCKLKLFYRLCEFFETNEKSNFLSFYGTTRKQTWIYFKQLLESEEKDFRNKIRGLVSDVFRDNYGGTNERVLFLRSFDLHKLNEESKFEDLTEEQKKCEIFNISISEPYKKFSFLPLQRSFVPRCITYTKGPLKELMVKYGIKNEFQNIWDNFDFSSIRRSKKLKFAGTISSDGIFVSLLFSRNKVVRRARFTNKSKNVKSNVKSNNSDSKQPDPIPVSVSFSESKESTSNINFNPNSVLIGIDPGRISIITWSKTLISELSNQPSPNKIYGDSIPNKDYQSAIRSDKIQAIQNNLYNFNTKIRDWMTKAPEKTVNSNQLLTDVSHMRDKIQELINFHSIHGFQQRKFNLYSNKQRIINQIITGITEKKSENIVGFGDWSNNDVIIKGHVKGPCSLIKHYFRTRNSKGRRIIRFQEIDEYKTSKLCYCCHEILDHSVKNGFWSYDTLLCRNNRCASVNQEINRDVNASVNILEKLKCSILGKKNMLAFVRSKR